MTRALAQPAHPLCAFLPWDSEFFGVRVASLQDCRPTRGELRAAVAWCATERIDCLYFLCAADATASANAAEDEGFRLVDVRIELQWSATESEAVMPAELPAGVRPAGVADEPGLLRLTDHAFQHSRFFHDAHFSRERVNELFRRWISQDLRGDGMAERVLLAESDSVAGYVTLNPEGGDGVRIGLIAIADRARQGGAGASLLAAAQAHCRQTGRRRLVVATQLRNVAAQRLFQRCGCRTEKVGLWFHKWFSRS
ncbi:MAG: GNAT family N-acetyltransferase [Acidobacteriota bacterium]